MSEIIEVSGKNVDEAKANAQAKLGVTSDFLEYEVIDKGSRGILGIGARDAVIKAWRKGSEKDKKQKNFENRQRPAKENIEKAEAEKVFTEKTISVKEVSGKPEKAEKSERADRPERKDIKERVEKKEIKEKEAPEKKEAPVKKEASDRPAKPARNGEKPAAKNAEKKEDRKKFDSNKTGGFKETVVEVKTVDQREEKERVPLTEEQKADIIEKARDFVGTTLTKMGIENTLDIKFDDAEQSVDIDVSGPDMGSLIGKRGQTLYAVQYLASLYVNKFTDDYIRIKIDTENYKERRTESLEKWANSMANKVRKTRRSIAVEPMNPYERRIIHVTLQNNPYVETYSEGVDPYRKIIIAPKR